MVKDDAMRGNLAAMFEYSRARYAQEATVSTQDTHIIPVTAATFTPEMARKMVEHNSRQSQADESSDFVTGAARFVNNRALTGVPFFIVSPWLERREEARVFPSGKSYPAHQVVQCMVRTVNPETFESFDAELATFTGEYLLNQFRNATEQELLNAGPWTLRQHPTLSMAKYGKPHIKPLMLARYNPARDVPAIDDWDTTSDAAPIRAAAPIERTPNGMPLAMDLYPLEQMLTRRNMSEADFLDMTGWDALAGHTPQQFTAAFKLIDRVRELAAVKSGDDAADASAKLASNTPKSRK